MHHSILLSLVLTTRTKLVKHITMYIQAVLLLYHQSTIKQTKAEEEEMIDGGEEEYIYNNKEVLK